MDNGVDKTCYQYIPDIFSVFLNEPVYFFISKVGSNSYYVEIIGFPVLRKLKRTFCKLVDDVFISNRLY